MFIIISSLMFQLEASISYLEFCVNKLKNEDRAIHNFLISTYVMSKNTQKLLEYLTEQSKVHVHMYHNCYLDCTCVYMYIAFHM